MYTSGRRYKYLLRLQVCTEPYQCVFLFINSARSDITGSCTGSGSPSTCYGDWATLSPVHFGDLASSTRTVSPSTILSASSSTEPISIPAYTPQPTAPGTWSTAECERYTEYVDTGDEDTNALANSCSYMAEFYSISVDDLERWNPNLQETNPCAFFKGCRYCVADKMNGMLATSASIMRIKLKGL